MKSILNITALAMCIKLPVVLCLSICTSIAWGNFEADKINLQSTFTTPTFQSVNFRQTFDRAPIVFALPTNQGGDVSAIRVQNVTTTGFEIIQVEASNLDGQHAAMTNVTYVAIQPGLYEINPGVFLDAAVWDTTSAVTGSAAFGGNGTFDNAEYRQDFGSVPAILSQIQTTNNETANTPTNASTPWMTSSVASVGTNNFNLALDRAEVNSGTITLEETIGYLALQDTTGTFLDSGSNSIDWEAIVSSDSIVGWDDGNTTINFNNTYSSTPLATASINSRDGENGGWLRRTSLTTTGIGLTVDEDTYTDAERNHTTEVAGIAAFSQAFDVELAKKNIEIEWKGQNAAGDWTTASNWKRWNGNDRNLQDGDTFLFNNGGSGVTTSNVNFNYTPEIGGITFEQSTSYTIQDDGGSLIFQDGASITNNSSVAQTIDVDISGRGSLLTFDSGSTAGGSMTFGPNGVIDLSDTGGLQLRVHGSNNTTINGAITGSNGILLKYDSGTLTLGGSAANTADGVVGVLDGTLALNKPDGTNALVGDVYVLGGTLLLQNNNQIADSANLYLANSTFDTGGYDEALGSLTLAADSTIDLGSGDSVIDFSDSSTSTWTGGTTLTVENWSGDKAGGGTDQLYFGNSSSGLTGSQLGQIKFLNPDGFAPGLYSAKQLASGEITPITPVPEPGTFIAGGFIVLVSGCALWRRKRSQAEQTTIA